MRQKYLKIIKLKHVTKFVLGICEILNKQTKQNKNKIICSSEKLKITE